MKTKIGFIYLAICALLSIPCIFFLFKAFSKNHAFFMFFWPALLILLWASFFLYSFNNIKFKLGSAACLFIICLPFSYLTIKRLIFIIENGGFDRADGFGSPLAFLIGVFFEQLFFIPILYLFCIVCANIWRSYKIAKA